MRHSSFESKADFYNELLSMLSSCDCEEIADFIFDVYCDMPQEEEYRLGFNEQDKDSIETLMAMDAGEMSSSSVGLTRREEEVMISTKEINALISDTLCGQLKGFSINKSKHIAVQKHDEKIYQIGWSVGNALNGFYYLHFWGGVRYAKIDDRYDSLFGQAPGFQSLIYCSFGNVGNTSNHGQFKVSTIQDVHDALAEVLAYINTELLPLFYCLKDENDFLNYLCDRERFFSWSEAFALKRIILAALTIPNRVTEMHDFNLSLWKEDGKELYIERYWRGIDKLKSEIQELIL